MSKNYFITSDLHLEFRKGKETEFWKAFPYHNEKVCLCAGDVTVFGLSDAVIYQHFLGLCSRFDKVIYTPGNHEYYGARPSEVRHRLAAIESALSPVLKVMDAGEIYEYDGQRFLGATMWFPDKPEVHIHKRLISDSFQIKDLFPWCFTQSHLFLNFLKENIKEDDIVITHHIPIDTDTNKMWKNGPTQPYFLNTDCERYLLNPNSILPKAWIYGHTHDKHDYYVGRTHYICNPIGYPGENGHLPDAAEPAIYEI